MHAENQIVVAADVTWCMASDNLPGGKGLGPVCGCCNHAKYMVCVLVVLIEAAASIAVWYTQCSCLLSGIMWQGWPGVQCGCCQCDVVMVKRHGLQSSHNKCDITQLKQCTIAGTTKLIWCNVSHRFEHRPRASSKQIAVFISCTTAVLVYHSFSANIVAEITVDQHRVPFGSLDDLLQDSTYTLGVTASSGILDYFNAATDGPTAEAYRRWLAPSLGCLPPSEWAGLHKVCSDMEHGSGHYAFAAAELVAQHFSHENPDCRLVALPQPRTLQAFAFALPRNSPFRDVINYKLLEMWRSGRMQRLRAQHSHQGDVTDAGQSFSAVGIPQTLVLVLLLVGGILIALLVLTAEIVMKVTLRRIPAGGFYRRKLLF
ncbi:glutamate receptor ionotropic, delta-2-like [Schistocerca serialis cubense]|uniref:glutamate receptor ionotropic, delta-2-like n=1 Tax=Schistocerca serialis cubense TaxID=2023355 RepID=UPI00214F0D49|nr:glutamate receptor ionotropic, delta-2-like [Schistocerca serialis cubense]